MKQFNILVQLVAIFFLWKCEAENLPNHRKWLEIDKQLYRIEPEGKYTWKEAVAECKKERSHLIRPKGDYDYAKLKEAIRNNFKHYSSFWTNNKVKFINIFHQLGLAKDQNNRYKCNKFDNSTSFKFVPDDCSNQLGFICEKPLLQGFSSFNANNTVFLVQPEQNFTCGSAYDECEKQQMSMVALKDFDRDQLLKNYVFINYGSSPSFWFAYNNETHYHCATYKGSEPMTATSKLGFICVRNYTKRQSVSMRHLILIIFLASAAVLAAGVYVFARCFCSPKDDDDSNLVQLYYPEETKVTDIK